MLEPTRMEYGNTAGNRFDFKMVKTPGKVNLLLNKEIYITMDAYKRFLSLINRYTQNSTVINRSTLASLEDSVRHFLRTCFCDCTATLEKPDYQHFKFDEALFFEAY